MFVLVVWNWICGLNCILHGGSGIIKIERFLLHVTVND